ncbi:MAG: Lrp/AsnC family transcriptional regulator [Candidatus Diapherotrites archaeon]|nr:Lrp/AsnC family transcriptional regulator [Candidatus Diapherotrites archaeon]
MIASLDRIEVLILKKLLEDGRTSYKAIAKEAQLTDVAIRKRVDSLKRRGIIKAIRAEVNYGVLGFEKPVYLQLRTELAQTKDVLKRIESFEHVLEIYQVLGEYNLLVKAVLPDLSSVKDFVERLSSISGVMDMKTLVVLDEVRKTNTLPASVMQKRF